MQKLGLLIPTTPDRRRLLDRLLMLINLQRGTHAVETIVYETKHLNQGGPNRGVKRNWCLDKAKEMGMSHVAFIDSDDIISPGYLELVMPGVMQDYDCCELWGQYYENNRQLNPFHHSIIYDHWFQDAKFYYRNPNHLNVIKLSLLNDIKFKDQDVGEDGHFSIALQESGVLKRQWPVNEIIYYYFAGGRKDHNLELAIAKRRGTKLIR